MDEMDIDTVLEVPDTPERMSAQRIGGLRFGKDSNAFTGHARRTEFLCDDRLNQRRSTDKHVLDNGHDRRGPSHPRRQPINVDEIEQRNSSPVFSSSGNYYTTASGPLLRRASCNSVTYEAGHGIAAHAIDKGKSVKNKHTSNLPVKLGNNEFLDLTELDEHRQMPGSVSSHVGSNKVQSGNVTGDVVSDSGSSRHLPPTSTFSTANKGKEKIDVFSCEAFGSAVDQGKKIGPVGGFHLPATSPRVTGQKRLVRNGCICPQNIASRAQKLAESNRASSTAAHKNHVANVSDGSSHPNIREIVTEDCSFNRAKGKGVVLRPPKPKECDVQNIHVSTSSVNEVANQMREVGKDEKSNGWRRTHNHVKKPNDSSFNVFDGCLLERDDGMRNTICEQNEYRMAKRDCERINTARVEPSLDKLSGRSCDASKLSKRQRKHGLTSRNHGDSSTMAPDDSEITFIGSSLEPSSSRSSRSRGFHPERNLYPIYEIDEPSYDMENNNSQGSGIMNNDDSEARARQLEADEILARELQEQFYNETPAFDEQQIDENVAWALQQVDNLLPAAYNQNHPVSRPRSSATVHSNRRLRGRSFTNSSNRRGASAQGTNNRAQLRNRVFNQPPTAVSRNRNRFPSSRGRSFHFPLGMDLDMRLDILEALEAAVGDFSDMSMNSDHMLRVQRDFNENDYEMLLALDDNNHQGGASVNQINGLPESVVQTDNFEEACAICLETPTRGETIRHLPCLHKFHKDCIDPWLRRKTSCPVCKSSVT